MKKLWLVRLGKNGEYEADAISDGALSIGFRIQHDISAATDRQSLTSVMEGLYPDEKQGTQRNFAAQVNQFVNGMQIGDLVVSPLKTSKKIAIGEVVGAYRQGPDGRPERPVKWLTTTVDRASFKQDLLYSFGAIMTVCEIKRNDALNRVAAVLRTGKDPGDGASVDVSGKQQMPTPNMTDVGLEDPAEDVDLELIARDQIERRIASSFAGHDFTRLIAAILTAQGYLTRVSPPGPDNGVDIVAGKGALGFDAPRLVVQVKSGDITADQPTLQGLIGCVSDTQADQGLLVSWSGFKPTVEKRTNELFFRVRLWGREEIVDALFSVYDKLPEDIRAELPLQRIWSVVPSDTL